MATATCPILRPMRLALPATRACLTLPDAWKAVRTSRCAPAAIVPAPRRHGAARPVVTYATDVDPDVVHLVRRRRFRRVGALLLGGTALAIGAFAACWKFIPVHSQVEANVHYAHLADTTEAERRQFAAGQSAILQNPGTRIAAVHAKPPELPGGFLDDPAAYSRIIEGVSWPTAQHDVLCINIQSTEPEADFIRVKALAQALYDANGVLIDDANRNRGRLADASDLLNNALRQAAELKKNIDASRAAADAWPSPETMETLTANVDRLEKAWKDAKVAEKNAQAEIERLKAASSSAVSTTQPAAAIAGTPDANVPDANIGQMQADLAAAQSKLAEAKATHDREAVQARAELDAALGQFQQQVAAAKELSRDNPELASYVTAAQKLQETTHKLVDDLINRQQQNYTRLTDLQARLGEKMQTPTTRCPQHQRGPAPTRTATPTRSPPATPSSGRRSSPRPASTWTRYGPTPPRHSPTRKPPPARRRRPRRSSQPRPSSRLPKWPPARSPPVPSTSRTSSTTTRRCSESPAVSTLPPTWKGRSPRNRPTPSR